jgi:hypothetical protein
LLGVQEVPGSNPGSPTKYLKDLQPADLLKPFFGVQLESEMDAAGACSNSSTLRPFGFLGALYSYTNPTFPTFESKVVDYVKPTVVGYAHFPDMQPDKTPDIFFVGSIKKTRCSFLLTTEFPN